MVFLNSASQVKKSNNSTASPWAAAEWGAEEAKERKMKSFTVVMFILQPEALLSKHLKIIPPYSPLGDKWSAYDTSRGNPPS